MKNPNGYGSVVKLSGARRRPYMARITVGWKDNGQPIYKALDYFSKREDALICLANYNAAQYSIDYRNITFAELYEKLREVKYPMLGSSLRQTLDAAYNYCSPIWKQRYRSIKAYQMQKCIDDCPRSPATKANIKNLFWHLDRLAFELDVIQKQYSQVLTVPTPTPKEKRIFTDGEVRELWKRQNEPGIDEVLFMLYTGLRISEVMNLSCDSIDTEQWYLKGGSKTEAGKNRIIPIHPDIQPLVLKRMGDGYLFPDRRFKANFSSYAPGHTSHECRHTFRSKLDSAGANKVAIDMLMGHKSGSIGERVYTHKTLDELRAAILLLRY